MSVIGNLQDQWQWVTHRPVPDALIAGCAQLGVSPVAALNAALMFVKLGVHHEDRLTPIGIKYIYDQLPRGRLGLDATIENAAAVITMFNTGIPVKPKKASA